MDNEYRRNHHCLYKCDYHIILPTKYRRKIFNDGIFMWVKRKLLDIPSHYPAIFFSEVNHDKDHIHILASIPPQMSVGSVIRIIKSNTARGMKEQFPFLKSVYWGTDGIWSDGYFVSTVGVDAESIARYIKRQGSEDAGQPTAVG